MPVYEVKRKRHVPRRTEGQEGSSKFFSKKLYCHIYATSQKQSNSLAKSFTSYVHRIRWKYVTITDPYNRMIMLEAHSFETASRGFKMFCSTCTSACFPMVVHPRHWFCIIAANRINTILPTKSKLTNRQMPKYQLGQCKQVSRVPPLFMGLDIQ